MTTVTYTATSTVEDCEKRFVSYTVFYKPTKEYLQDADGWDERPPSSTPWATKESLPALDTYVVNKNYTIVKLTYTMEVEE